MADNEYLYEDPEYVRICKKLGFEPKKRVFLPKGYEDDNIDNAFSKITVEEGFYLYEHGYM